MPQKLHWSLKVSRKILSLFPDHRAKERPERLFWLWRIWPLGLFGGQVGLVPKSLHTIANSLMFWYKVRFFSSFPSFVISLEVALGTFSIAVVINPESEGAESYSQGKYNIDKRGGWAFRGGYKKGLRQRSTLKWMLCHQLHSVLTCLKSDGPRHNASQAALLVARPTGTRLKIADALNTFFMFLQCLNILPWLALFS